MKEVKRIKLTRDSTKETKKQSGGKNNSRKQLYIDSDSPLHVAKESAYPYSLSRAMSMDEFKLLETSRKGISYLHFLEVVEFSGFTIKEWAGYIQLTERTLQRYKAENRLFEPIYSERILGIARLLQKGVAVFGNMESFGKWLNAENVALGKIAPRQLLDSTFGISILEDELTRIEHGIFA